jgi:hypothetical protein
VLDWLEYADAGTRLSQPQTGAGSGIEWNDDAVTRLA